MALQATFPSYTTQNDENGRTRPEPLVLRRVPTRRLFSEEDVIPITRHSSFFSKETPSMTTLLTGASGFVGSWIARMIDPPPGALRVLARPTSDLSVLDDLPVEVAEGDLLDPPSLRQAMDGVRRVYHAAGTISFRFPPPPRSPLDKLVQNRSPRQSVPATRHGARQSVPAIFGCGNRCLRQSVPAIFGCDAGNVAGPLPGPWKCGWPLAPCPPLPPVLAVGV